MIKVNDTEPHLDSLEDLLGLDDAFNPSDWINEHVDNAADTDEPLSYAKKRSFYQICKTIREELDEMISDFDDESRTDKDNVWLERQHKAVIGNEQARSYFINSINEKLQNLNITTKDYPFFYDSLAEAIFHTVWGVGILHKWEKYPDSEAAVIRGTELWIDINGKFVRQPEQFQNEEEVLRIRRSFTLRLADAVINEQEPELEIEREDGSRITMMQPPRSREHYIMFRRFTVKELTLEQQAKLGTIKHEDIPIFKALSRTMCNTIFAGRVRSAKSTFMKTMLGVRDPQYVAAVMEKHFELRLSDQMKNQLVFEVQAKEGDLHHAMPRLLRMEHDYIVVGEIRGIETEGYLQSCERGERGSYSTYHLTNVNNVVPQITRHILDEFPSRKFEYELERVARNIDLIITLSSDRDRRRKRVIGVTEIIWNDERRSFSTNDIIRYSPITDEYYYSSKISEDLLLLMSEENLEETKILISQLKIREKESSMNEYRKIAGNLFQEILGVELNG